MTDKPIFKFATYQPKMVEIPVNGESGAAWIINEHGEKVPAPPLVLKPDGGVESGPICHCGECSKVKK